MCKIFRCEFLSKIRKTLQYSNVSLIVNWKRIIAISIGTLVLTQAIIYLTPIGMYSVGSTSMTPTLNDGDIVVTYETGDYDAGDVVVYRPDGQGDRLVIHRTQRYVEIGDKIGSNENGWYNLATNDGWITQGDNLAHSDQYNGLSTPVKDSWIKSEVVVSIPTGVLL